MVFPVLGISYKILVYSVNLPCNLGMGRREGGDLSSKAGRFPSS